MYCEAHLSVTVFAGLRGGHLHDFTGTAFNHHEATLAEGRALHGEGLGGAGISLVEVMIVVVTHSGEKCGVV